MTTVYITDNLSDITPSELDSAIASLPSWRREQALRFKHEQGRKECAFSYLLLCRALKEQYDLDVQPSFFYGEHGKPVLEGYPHIHFNLSHCKSAIACAVSDAEVGIDIEGVGRYKESLARYSMSDAEMQHIVSASNPDHAFTSLWTQKEAVFKLTGSGINDNIKDLLYEKNAIHASSFQLPPFGGGRGERPVFVRSFDDISDSYVLSVALFEKKPLKILKF